MTFQFDFPMGIFLFHRKSNDSLSSNLSGRKRKEGLAKNVTSGANNSDSELKATIVPLNAALDSLRIVGASSCRFLASGPGRAQTDILTTHTLVTGGTR